MSDADAVLVRVAAHADAVALPLRDWGHPAGANRHQMGRPSGVVYRVNTGASDAARKAGERLLAELADLGLVLVNRGARVKFPVVALTPAGDAAARALAGLPDRAVGRLFVAAVAERAAGYKPDPVRGLTWVPEIEFNKGRGWGAGATREDRRQLSMIELHFLAAAAAGWAVAHSTAKGHAAYAVTPAGRAELDDPTPDPPSDRAFAEAAGRLYRAEQNLKLDEILTRPPDNPQEIGWLPLPSSAMWRHPAVAEK